MDTGIQTGDCSVMRPRSHSRVCNTNTAVTVTFSQAKNAQLLHKSHLTTALFKSLKVTLYSIKMHPLLNYFALRKT